MYANISNTTRRRVYARDHYACALCDSSQGLQIHHVIPRGEGGSNDVMNLITLCAYCHSHVHGRPLYDTPMTADDLTQACVEYLADLYAPRWNPLTVEEYKRIAKAIRKGDANYLADCYGPREG